MCVQCIGSWDNEVVTKLRHVVAPPCVPVIRSGRYVDSALFVQAEVKSDDWNASWRHQTNGALSDNPIYRDTEGGQQEHIF